MIERVVVDRDQCFQTRTQTGAQAVFRVFEGEAVGGVQSHFFQRVKIDVGRRFFGGHDVACRNHFEPVLCSGTQAVLQQDRDVFRRGGGGDRQAQSGGARLDQQALDPGANRNATVRSQLRVMAGFAFVQFDHHLVEIGGLLIVRTIVVDIVFHALFATRHGKQLAIEGNVPMPVEPGIGKGLVERGTVAVALGVGKGAVNVENKGL